ITASPAASHGAGSRSRSHCPAGAARTAPTRVISEIVAPSANGDRPNARPTWAETGPTLPREAAARIPAAIVLAGRTHSPPGTAPSRGSGGGGVSPRAPARGPGGGAFRGRRVGGGPASGKAWDQSRGGARPRGGATEGRKRCRKSPATSPLTSRTTR